jgi:nucleoside phosphorylase/CheY-like chemotaxis protein
MIKILIVDDAGYKSDKIRHLLTDDAMLMDKDITSVANIKAAKRLLVKETYDLLILDLVLPLDIGDTPTPEKGIGFLKDLEINPGINPPIHIIGLTEFGDLKEKFENEFGKYLWHLIAYSPTEFNWQDKLKSIVYHLVSIRKRYIESAESNHSFDVAVITALNRPEFDKILDWPVAWDRFQLTSDPTTYYKAEIRNNDKIITVVSACVDQMGMTATAVLVAKMIHQFKPETFIMGGICAGLRERGLNYGDILIAEQSWDYGSGKMKDAHSESGDIRETIFEPDIRPVQLSPSLKSKVNTFLRRKEILLQIQAECKYAKPDNLLSAALGPIASGSYVISSENRLNEIKQVQRKLLGVEMEGYGLYYACEHHQDKAVKGLMIKSVSDYGDSKKDDQYQDYSSFTSAQFIYHFIREELM